MGLGTRLFGTVYTHAELVEWRDDAFDRGYRNAMRELGCRSLYLDAPSDGMTVVDLFHPDKTAIRGVVVSSLCPLTDTKGWFWRPATPK